MTKAAQIAYTRTFPSSLDEVNLQIGTLITHLDQILDHYNRFELDLIMREVLNNAVIHGNRQNPVRKVGFSLELDQGQFKICVTDEGAGFDWTDQIQQDSVQENNHGRGFPILRTYCTSIAHNEKGNQITLTFPSLNPIAGK